MSMSQTSAPDDAGARESRGKNSPWVEKWRARFWDLREQGSLKDIHVWSRVPYGFCRDQVIGADRTSAQVLFAQARDVHRRHPEVVAEFLSELVEFYGYLLAERPAGCAASVADVLQAHAHSMGHGAEVERELADALSDDGSIEPDEARRVAAAIDRRIEADQEARATVLRASIRPAGRTA